MSESERPTHTTKHREEHHATTHCISGLAYTLSPQPLTQQAAAATRGTRDTAISTLSAIAPHHTTALQQASQPQLTLTLTQHTQQRLLQQPSRLVTCDVTLPQPSHCICFISAQLHTIRTVAVGDIRRSSHCTHSIVALLAVCSTAGRRSSFSDCRCCSVVAFVSSPSLSRPPLRLGAMR